MNETEWHFMTGIILLELANTSYQVIPTGTSSAGIQNNYHTIISEHFSCPDHQLRFVMDPKFTYPELFPDTFGTIYTLQS